MKKKLKLKDITLCAVACTEIPGTLNALKKSMRGIEYGRVLFITHENIDTKNSNIEVVKIEKLDYKGYNNFMLYRLKDYIDTDFVLIVQYDGYVLHPQKWTDKFLDYDYIGAPWPKNRHFTKEGRNIRVGNGGFSLRSKKLLHILSDLNLPLSDFGTGFFHEDGIICSGYREILEKNSIKFAPIDIASAFSRERWCRDSHIFPFGFHSNRKNFLKYLYKKLVKLFS